MSAIEVILLHRIEKLGQMGEVVRVKPGFARNFLLPKGYAIRATAQNREKFDQQRIQLEANNIQRREEAEILAERMNDLTIILIRQAGESGSLYGSVSSRDIALAAMDAGLTINRSQVKIDHPIKMLGVSKVGVQLHPEVSITISVNVARSAEEAARQAKAEHTNVDDKVDQKENSVPSPENFIAESSEIDLSHSKEEG